MLGIGTLNIKQLFAIYVFVRQADIAFIKLSRYSCSL